MLRRDEKTGTGKGPTEMIRMNRVETAVEGLGNLIPFAKCIYGEISMCEQDDPEATSQLEFQHCGR